MMKYRRSLQKRTKTKEKNKDNRLQILATIVFLFGAVLVYKLVDLQIVKYDFYVALASDQHLVQGEINAKRGRIFIRDNNSDSSNKQNLYPLATNKDFAFVYAVPKDIADPLMVSEEMYKIFDEEGVQKEVEQLLESDEYFRPLFPRKSSQTESEEELKLSVKELEGLREILEIKREAEILLRKEEKTAFYMSRLDKPGDPYEPIRRKVDEETLTKIMAIETKGIDYFYEKHRYYPEKEMGSHIVGFVGYQGDKEAGRYGLEGFFDVELSGKTGSIKAERAASGKLLILNDRELEHARDGSDIILTIDRSIQFMACKRLREEARRLGADGGTILVMQPESGAILAMCSWPEYDPNNYSSVKSINVYNNPAIFDAYEPGSIFKPFTIAAGIDMGKITPQSTYEDKGFLMIEGWNKPIKNSNYETHGGHGVVDMNTVLKESLNTGTMHVVNKIGADNFARYVKNFGIGEKTGIELETEGVTNIQNLLRNRIRPIEAATASFGQGISATPLQITSAFGAIANGGILMKPYLVSEILSPDGTSYKTQPQQIRRVISEKTSLLVSGMLVNVVDDGHAKLAGVDGYYVGGKTGTAQVASGGGYGKATIHSFVGFAPIEDPKFVMLVKLDNPKIDAYSASTAAPLFGELADFILNYYQVKKER